MKRTICLKIIVDKKESCNLLDLQKAFAKTCNEISTYAYENKCINSVKLHHLCYYRIREKIPMIGSQMICNAMKKVANSYKSLKRKKEKHSLICFRPTTSVHFDKRTYSLKDDWLSLYTLNKRIKIKYAIGDFQKEYLKQGEIKEAELIRRGNNWFFNLSLDLPDTPFCKKNQVMAVDLGENNLAATSFGSLYGGKKLRHERDKFLAFRGRLQSKGTQSAKQLLKKVSGKEQRHVRQTNHEISKEIVLEAKKNNVGIIVMENLTNIRKRIRGNKRMRSRLHRWPFSQLQTFVEYKAQTMGIEVIYVNAAYSSQTCSKCQKIGIRKKHCFKCSNCGSQQHADINACQNLCRLAVSADIATCAVNRTNVAPYG